MVAVCLLVETGCAWVETHPNDAYIQPLSYSEERALEAAESEAERIDNQDEANIAESQRRDEVAAAAAGVGLLLGTFWLLGKVGGGSSGSGSGTSSSSGSGSGERDCEVTYDARRYETADEGVNAIRIDCGADDWSVSYRFGSCYLMYGSGNLEGKTIQVSFRGGRPDSMRSSYGRGRCDVSSSTKR
jgi:hypothetical protein